MNQSKSSFVKIGIVGKAHGLSGLFFLSGRDSLFEHQVNYVYIKQMSSYKKMKLTHHLVRGGKTVLGLDRIKSREDLSLYQGAFVYVSRDEIDVGAGEFLWDDVLNRKVVDCNGKLLGKVEKLDNFGASNIITIKDESDKTWMIPFTQEFFDMNFSQDSNEPLTTKYEGSYFDAFRSEN